MVQMSSYSVQSFTEEHCTVVRFGLRTEVSWVKQEVVQFVVRLLHALEQTHSVSNRAQISTCALAQEVRA